MHCFIFILIASWRDFFFGMDCAVSKGEKVFRNAGKTVLRAAWETNSQDVPHSVNIISPHDIRGAAEKSLSATAPAPRVSTFVVCVRNTQSLALCVYDISPSRVQVSRATHSRSSTAHTAQKISKTGITKHTSSLLA